MTSDEYHANLVAVLADALHDMTDDNPFSRKAELKIVSFMLNSLNDMLLVDATDEQLKITDREFEFVEPGSAGDNISCVKYGNGITIICEQPWAGDTESGFGQDCSIRLDYKTAQQLGIWLISAKPTKP